VTSIYNQSFDGALDEDMKKKVLFDGIEDDAIAHLDNPTYSNILKVAIDNSDGLVIGSEEISEDLKAYIEKLDLPTLPYTKREEMANAYQTYYLKDILNEEED